MPAVNLITSHFFSPTRFTQIPGIQAFNFSDYFKNIFYNPAQNMTMIIVASVIAVALIVGVIYLVKRAYEKYSVKQ